MSRAPGPYGERGEFRLIREILAGARPSAAAQVGAGDDAVVLADGLAISSDLSVEGVHFRWSWLPAREVGVRAANAALSDLAAMDADVIGVLASVAIDPAQAEGTVPELMEGVRWAVEELEGALLGGDLSRVQTGAPAVIDIVVVGRAERPLVRSGARPGDELWVTGRLGGAAAAVAAWETGNDPSPDALHAYARPVPRVAEVRWIRQRADVHAGIDLSDGLLGDAEQLAGASNVCVVIDPAAVPRHAATVQAGESSRSSERDPALAGGEDYELLLAAPAGALSGLVPSFHSTFGIPLTRVGRVEPGSGVAIRGEQGDLTRMDGDGGFDHFGGGRR